MGFKNTKVSWYLRSGTFAQFVRVLYVMSGALSLALFLQIDRIVHQDLYNYGLRFSYDWANTYWTVFRSALAFICIPTALSAVQLTADLMAWLKAKRRNINAEVRQSVTIEKAKNRKVNGARKSRNSWNRKRRQEMKGSENRMLMECSKCGKTFTKPLVMLDFTGEKGKLINLCPYCDSRLEDNKEDDVVDYYVIRNEEKLVKGRQ